MFEGNVTYQFIGNVTNGATSGSTAGKDIAAGSVALVSVADNLVYETNQTAATTPFRIVQKTAGGQLIYSPQFYMSKTSISSTVYTAPTEQISYWGYNGSTGSLGTPVTSNTYILHVELKHTMPGIGSSPLVKTIPYVATSTNQYALAAGLCDSFDRVFNREVIKFMKAEVVNSGTSTATSGGAWTVVQGSKYVTTVESAGSAADAAKYNSDAATVVAGDFIRFGHATTTTYPIYKVVSITGGGTAAATVELDRPYKGTSGTVAAANAGVIAAADIGNSGLKFTGLDRFASIPFNPQVDYYSKVRFSIQSADFGDYGGETVSQGATEGAGSAYEVAQMEQYTQMNEHKDRYISAYPAPNYRAEADLTTPGTYDTMVLDCYDDNMISIATGIRPVSKFKIIIRTKVALNGDDVDTALNVTV